MEPILNNELPPNAVGIETLPFKYQFTPEEREKMRLDHTDKMIECDFQKNELKKVKEEFGRKIKKSDTETFEIRKKLSLGFEFQNRPCYLMPDQELGKMQYVCIDSGEILFERKLTPDERQLNILQKKLA